MHVKLKRRDDLSRGMVLTISTLENVSLAFVRGGSNSKKKLAYANNVNYSRRLVS